MDWKGWSVYGVGPPYSPCPLVLSKCLEFLTNYSLLWYRKLCYFNRLEGWWCWGEYNRLRSIFLLCLMVCLGFCPAPGPEGRDPSRPSGTLCPLSHPEVWLHVLLHVTFHCQLQHLHILKLIKQNKEKKLPDINPRTLMIPEQWAGASVRFRW